MLSRRSVRIKVMQRLYALNRDEQSSKKEALQQYDSSVAASYDLFFYNIYVLYQTTLFAVVDQEKRKKKHLKTKEDEKFVSKLATNDVTKSIVENESVAKRAESRDFDAKYDKDILGKVYRDFGKTDDYLSYVYGESNQEDHITQLLDLFRFCRNNEMYKEQLEDHYTNWSDDKSLVIGMTKKVIKSLPNSQDLLEIISPVDESVETFGRELLEKVLENDQALHDLIEPKLQNWDADRVAILDTICIKMALSEFLHFPTIPLKVTLNEYVDISKKYSTAKSKDFVNGILDRLMNDLRDQDKITKTGRGLLE